MITVDEDNNLPAVSGGSNSEFESKLSKIEDQLYSIAERQKTGVSPEFSALMDGYVNKANESQEYKVKFEHLEKLHDDLRIEYKTLHEDNKKFKTELEASRDALRQSETDLQRHRKETENTRMHYDEQVASLVDERERLKTKVKQLMDHKEKTAQEYNDLKAELLEHKYKAKQLEQEKQVEIESARRSVRESNKIIEELKEKLDLRTREVEYKDALLNQLIKQVSAEETYNNSDSIAGNYAPTNTYASNYDRPVERPVSSVKFDEGGEAASWGAFRK
jgi:predicted  nucleic acid-binding Zn-ribbon protein